MLDASAGRQIVADQVDRTNSQSRSSNGLRNSPKKFKKLSSIRSPAAAQAKYRQQVPYLQRMDLHGVAVIISNPKYFSRSFSSLSRLEQAVGAIRSVP